MTYPLFCDDAEFAKCIAEEAEARRQQEFESLTPAQRSAEIRGQERTRRLLERQSERDREQARERLERYLRERDNSR